MLGDRIFPIVVKVLGESGFSCASGL